MLFHRAIVALALLPSFLYAHAQFETVIVAPVHAKRLAGVILDPTGGPVSNAVIERLDCPAGRSYPVPENHILQVANTDANGSFNMRPAETKGSYCLRVRSPGFNHLEVQVNIRRFSHDLRLTLTIAS